MNEENSRSGILYVVATPIGNLGDVSARALDTLRQVDVIACEDTRITKRLLDKYQLAVAVISYHQHSKIAKVDYIVSLLQAGKLVALVSDAGTPGIADPGNKLVAAVYQRNKNQKSKIKVVAVPGPAAVTAALSIAGLPVDRFIFLGFAPTKKGREKFFSQIAESKIAVVFYESPYRIIKTLEKLREVLVAERLVVVCRELTKVFESIYRGNAAEVIAQITGDKIKGEFVVIVEAS